MAKKTGLPEPKIDSDGSILFVPLPDHNDPDFENLTYGDPSGRLNKFGKGDIAWFIESGTVSDADWGYYLVAWFEIEGIFSKKRGVWDQQITGIHMNRITMNAHELFRDTYYTIILGNPDTSHLLFGKPLRISMGQDALDEFKIILNLSMDKPTTGYWFKRWFDDEPTRKLLQRALLQSQ